MTAISYILPLSKNNEDTAAKNGMTPEQFAASQIVCNRSDIRTNSDCLAVLRDKATALAAFDRIAQIEEIEKGSPFIPTDKLIAAILA